jgi:hypothetical protein
MLAQFVAKRAAVHAAASGFDRGHFRVWAAMALAAVSLGGCLPNAPPLVGADAADPSAKVAAATYRSTTAPYTAMRPTAPAAWGGQNSSAPAPGTDR